MRFALVKCFNALFTGYPFSRAFHWLHVFPCFALLTCFPALFAGTRFPALFTGFPALVSDDCAFHCYMFLLLRSWLVHFVLASITMLLTIFLWSSLCSRPQSIVPRESSLPLKIQKAVIKEDLAEVTQRRSTAVNRVQLRIPRPVAQNLTIT